MTTLTLEKLMAACNKAMAELGPPPPKIIETVQAVDASRRQWLFPPSKHRSKRVHKKLLKRHGVQYRDPPAVLRVGDLMLVHPALTAQIPLHTGPMEHPVFVGLPITKAPR